MEQDRDAVLRDASNEMLLAAMQRCCMELYGRFRRKIKYEGIVSEEERERVAQAFAEIEQFAQTDPERAFEVLQAAIGLPPPDAKGGEILAWVRSKLRSGVSELSLLSVLPPPHPPQIALARLWGAITDVHRALGLGGED
jgi:hypothetical protein